MCNRGSPPGTSPRVCLQRRSSCAARHLSIDRPRRCQTPTGCYTRVSALRSTTERAGPADLCGSSAVRTSGAGCRESCQNRLLTCSNHQPALARTAWASAFSAPSSVLTRPTTALRRPPSRSIRGHILTFNKWRTC